jgi:kumamolisin
LNLENGLITSNSTYINEIGWSGSNGGYSRVFARPSYQNGIHQNSKRGVPDLSANADPNSGYKICFANKCMKLGGNEKLSICYYLNFFTIRKIDF